MTIYASSPLDATCTWASRGSKQTLREGDRGFTRWTLPRSAEQQSCFWETPSINKALPTLYAAAMWRFPQGYTWDGLPGSTSPTHKMLILNCAGAGRTHVCLKGGGTSPRLAILFERVLPDAWHESEVTWPADGQWHRLEVFLDRMAGQARVRLDGRLAINYSGAVAGSPPGIVENVQVGAYVNQGSMGQYFDVRGLIVADADSVQPTPQPIPTPPTPPVDVLGTLLTEIETLAQRTRERAAEVATDLSTLELKVRELVGKEVK